MVGLDPLDPRNNELTSVRDGRSASSTDNTYLTQYAYNGQGQLTTETSPPTSDFPNGRVTSYTYSAGTEAGYSGGTIPGLLLTKTTPGGGDYYGTPIYRGVASNHEAFADAQQGIASPGDVVGHADVYAHNVLGRHVGQPTDILVD